MYVQYLSVTLVYTGIILLELSTVCVNKWLFGVDISEPTKQISEFNMFHFKKQIQQDKLKVNYYALLLTFFLIYKLKINSSKQ